MAPYDAFDTPSDTPRDTTASDGHDRVSDRPTVTFVRPLRTAIGPLRSPERVLQRDDVVPFRVRQAGVHNARIAAFAPLLLLVHLAHVAIFLPGWWRAGAEGEWTRAIVSGHGIMAVFAALAWVASRALRARPNESAAVPRRRLSVAVAWAYLGFSAWIAGVDQLVTSNVTPYLVGSLGVALMLPMRTLPAVGCFGIAYAVYVALVRMLQPDPAVGLSNVVNGLSITVLSFGLARLFEGWSAREFADRRTIERQQLALAAANRELVRLATGDPLTGLPNRRHILTRAEELRRLCRRTDRSLAVLLLDVDHFKRVNDTRGHPVGDAVLVAVAERIRSTMRTSDVPGRLGGEEFAALLPDTTLEGAAQVSERLRRAVEELAIEAAPGLRVTISVGVTVLEPASDDAVHEALARADKALYEAKRQGRNRVIARPAEPNRENA